MTVTKFENLKADSLIEMQLNKSLDKIEELNQESSELRKHFLDSATLNKKLKEENLKLESEIKELKKRQMTPLLHENKELTDALKSSLFQIAYLVETVKTFDADFFKIKGFNDDSIEKDTCREYLSLKNK